MAQKVTGIITSITPTEIYVDLGTKHAGYIPTSEFSDAGKPVEELFKPGDEIEAIVVRVNDMEGTVILSKKRLDAAKFWDEIEQICEDKTTVEGTITEENKGGLVADVKGGRAVHLAFGIRAPAVLLRHTLGKIDGHLGVDQAPVLSPPGPLFCNVHHGQI